MKRQNISGHCQQTFENKKFVNITLQCFALLPQVNFPANDLNFYWSWKWWESCYPLKSFLLHDWALNVTQILLKDSLSLRFCLCPPCDTLSVEDVFSPQLIANQKKATNLKNCLLQLLREKILAIQHILLKLQKKEYKRHDYQKLNDTYLDDNW